MTVTRYDLITGREGGDGKTYWTKIGSMFPSKDGTGFNLAFDALPIPQMYNGKLTVSVRAVEPKEKTTPAGRPAGTGAPAQTRPQSRSEHLDDDIPF